MLEGVSHAVDPNPRSWLPSFHPRLAVAGWGRQLVFTFLEGPRCFVVLDPVPCGCSLWPCAAPHSRVIYGAERAAVGCDDVMSAQRRWCWAREHGQLQLQGPSSTGTPGTFSGDPVPDTGGSHCSLARVQSKGVFFPLCAALQGSLWPWGPSRGRLVVSCQPLAPAQGEAR